jgi:predicted dehydrogenase
LRLPRRSRRLPKPLTSDRISARAPLGAAVVGFGVGEQHARVYVDHPLCALRQIYDIDPDAVYRAHATFESATIAASFDDLLSDPTVDIISIASYDDAHFGQVLAALESRRHVFVEKPLCRSLDELQRVKIAWRKSARQLAANLVLRGAPLYQWLRSAIAAGELGEIFAIDGDYLYGRLGKVTGGWRKDVIDYSVIQGGGIHLVDLMLWLTGQRPASVTAAGGAIAARGTAFRYNDFVAATYRFESGLVGRITANFGCVHPHQHVLRVFGTRATFIHDDRGARLQGSREPSAPWRPLDLSPLPPSKGVLIPRFVQSIVGDCDGAAETQHEFDLMSACLAADRAVASGGAEKVPYV